ncbi:MAG: hypothetical protein M3R52_10440, partial [Acidobacteriota bacterium]|nr:hypothetical protein [Acidobacteriota bacterium]
MSGLISRREVLGCIVSAGTAALLDTRKVSAQTAAIVIADRPIEVAVASVSSHTVRISMVAIESAHPKPIPYDGSLVQQTWAPPRARLRTLARREGVRLGNLMIRIEPDPLSITIEEKDGR